MKMTNKIKNNFIQLILESKNNDNINEIVKININFFCSPLTQTLHQNKEKYFRRMYQLKGLIIGKY